MPFNVLRQGQGFIFKLLTALKNHNDAAAKPKLLLFVFIQTNIISWIEEEAWSNLKWSVRLPILVDDLPFYYSGQ